MSTDREEQPALNDDRESRISFFIPSVELKGSRADKLKNLNVLIKHVERLRRQLAGDVNGSRGGYETRSRFAAAVWPSVAAAILAATALLVLTLVVRSCA